MTKSNNPTQPHLRPVTVELESSGSFELMKSRSRNHLGVVVGDEAQTYWVRFLLYLSPLNR